MSRYSKPCRIYVGNLHYDIQPRDIDNIFYGIGTIVYLNLVVNRSLQSAFAFVDFKTSRSATSLPCYNLLQFSLFKEFVCR